MSTNFVPKKRNLTGVTIEEEAVVSTSTDHGYLVDEIITIFVPEEYGMRMDYITAKIIDIVSDSSFRTDLDTTNYDPYVTPPSSPPVTEAHCVVVTGEIFNNTTVFG